MVPQSPKMKKYYIHQNDRQEGPFSLEELKRKHLTSEIPIWHDGLPEWTTVKNLAEVNELIPPTPPPFKNKPFTSTWRFLKFAAIVFLLSLGIMAINSTVNKSNNNVNTSTNFSASIDPQQKKVKTVEEIEKPASKDPNKKKEMTAEEIEKADPLRFVSASGQSRKTIFGKYTLNMKVENSATVTKYKDVVVKIEYISASNSVINTEERRFNEIFPPHSTKNYEFKISKPSESSKLRVSVIQALSN